jgi:anti-sigma B factor antagonist
MDINIKTLEVTSTSTATQEQVTIAELIGDIDGKTAPQVQAAVIPVAQLGSKLLLDMTKVPYMSSAGLRTLLSLHRQISGKDGQMVLVGVAEEIQDTMSITGFINFLTICDSIEAALEILKVKAEALPA